jgi:hypothetical protein
MKSMTRRPSEARSLGLFNSEAAAFRVSVSERRRKSSADLLARYGSLSNSTVSRGTDKYI